MRTNRSSLLGLPLALGAALLCAWDVRAQDCTGAPSVCGEWGEFLPMKLTDPQPGEPLGYMRNIHSIMLHTGKVLCIDQLTFGDVPHVVLFDPADGSISLVSSQRNINGHRLFCSGHSALIDGRIFFSGGGALNQNGSFKTTIFDPSTSAFVAGPDEIWCLDQSNCPGSEDETFRWYPTCTTMADGNVLVTDGWTHGGPAFGNGNIPVILQVTADPPGQWTWQPLYGAEYNTDTYNFDLQYYPFMFLLSSTRVFMANSHFADPEVPSHLVSRDLYPALQTWSHVDSAPIKGGSAVLYRAGTVMKAGGGTSGTQLGGCEFTMVSDKVYSIGPNIAEETPWTQLAAMPSPRLHFYLIALPDGKVLAVGGTSGGPEGDFCNPDYAVLDADLYDPYSGVWTTLAAMSVPRFYHSSAVLLPDGSIFIAGGQQIPDPAIQKTYQIFQPPYFFQGSRPTISSSPAVINYGQAFSVTSPQGEQVTKVRLIRPGSATHSFDHDQRSMELNFVIESEVAGDPMLTVAAPAHGFQAPPGYYRLFIATGTNGSLPSEGELVRLIP